MKFFLMLLFMLLAPLQATEVLAASSHAHHPENQTHAVTQHCDHESQQNNDHKNSHAKIGECCHHHCHVPNLAILSTTPLLHSPVFFLKTVGIGHTEFQSFLSSRIERPKWA